MVLSFVIFWQSGFIRAKVHLLRLHVVCFIACILLGITTHKRGVMGISIVCLLSVSNGVLGLFI